MKISKGVKRSVELWQYKGSLLPFNSQEIVDSLRNTITVTLPIALFFYLGFPAEALGIGTGSLLICLTDLPGSRSEKLSGALLSIPVFGITAIITAFAIQQIVILPFVIALLTFLLMMFAALGQRMAAIGLMGLAMVAFTIGHHPVHPIEYGALVAIGGLWYFLVSLSQVWIFPHHSLKRALAKTRKDTAALMRLRARGYDTEVSLSGFNAENIRLHLKLTNDHELVRRLLLGDRFNAGFNNEKFKPLLKQGIILIDLYEQVSAVHYDYPGLRKNLQGLGVLGLIKNAIEQIAEKLEGYSVDVFEYEQLILRIEEITLQSAENMKMLGGIVSNLKQTGTLVFALDDKRELDNKMQVEQFPGFLTEGGISFAKLKIHLTYESQIFRFALRMSLLMLLVVFAIGFLPKGSYGYWLPITLIVISRPSYGMTMKRNAERVMGTLAGLVLGWSLLELNLATPIQLSIAIVALFIFFSFLSLRYWLSAMGITLAIVLCLSIYHGHSEQILSERLLFTIFGCLIGLFATFLFPVRHTFNLKTAILNAILTNRNYLSKVVASDEIMIDIKLARKRSYLALSALNEAISLAAREPKWKRGELRALRQIELLCFQLNALTAALPLKATDHDSSYAKSITELDNCVRKIDKLPHGKVFSLKAMERLDGPLDLLNVSGKLSAIFLY